MRLWSQPKSTVPCGETGDYVSNRNSGDKKSGVKMMMEVAIWKPFLACFSSEMTSKYDCNGGELIPASIFTWFTRSVPLKGIFQKNFCQ